MFKPALQSVGCLRDRFRGAVVRRVQVQAVDGAFGLREDALKPGGAQDALSEAGGIQIAEQRGPYGTTYARNQTMRWQRPTLLRRIALGARANWLSFLTPTKSRGRPEQVRVFCKRCRAETLHDRFDDSGWGWYAQFWQCRVCGQEAIEVLPIAH